jgi:hypothetical protein
VTLAVAEVEAKLGEAALLVSDIVEARETGNRDPHAGNADDDLRAAVDDLDVAIIAWLCETSVRR